MLEQPSDGICLWHVAADSSPSPKLMTPSSAMPIHERSPSSFTLTDHPRPFATQPSPLGEKILDISEAQAEAMVSPDCIADDLGSKTIAAVTRPIALHRTSLSV